MTKYAGKHRVQKKWSPPEWRPRHTIATLLIAAGLHTLYPAPANADPEKAHVDPPVSPPPLRFTPLEQVKVVPEPPDLPGDDQQVYNDWVLAGQPDYQPDPHNSKGLVAPVAPEGQVVVVQAVCDKPDLPGLSDDALFAYRTICALFPEITTFGGFRAGDQDHGTGNAIDNMVYDDTATGDALAAFLIDHADELHVKYIIWKQRIWQNLDGLRFWDPMEDRGSPTQNHYDHVHLSVN